MTSRCTALVAHFQLTPTCTRYTSSIKTVYKRSILRVTALTPAFPLDYRANSTSSDVTSTAIGAFTFSNQHLPLDKHQRCAHRVESRLKAQLIHHDRTPSQQTADTVPSGAPRTQGAAGSRHTSGSTSSESYYNLYTE